MVLEWKDHPMSFRQEMRDWQHKPVSSKFLPLRISKSYNSPYFQTIPQDIIIFHRAGSKQVLAANTSHVHEDQT